MDNVKPDTAIQDLDSQPQLVRRALAVKELRGNETRVSANLLVPTNADQAINFGSADLRHMATFGD